MLDHPDFLRRVLFLDAASGALTGLLMTMASAPLATLTGLSPSHLMVAGLVLFPVAAFMAYVGSRRPIPALAVWLIILGNVTWATLSVWVLAGGLGPLTTFGTVFVAVQAAAVVVLALLEAMGLSRVQSA